MIGELTNHLWQSTLFAAAAGLLATAFRKNRAQIRYWLWLAASLKFLVPFALLISLGSHLGWAPATKTSASQAASLTIVRIAQPFPDSLSFVRSAPRTTDWPLIAILGVWLCGFGVIALMRTKVWLRIRAAVRSSLPLEIPAAIQIRSSQGLLEPGVAGLFKPVLLLPDGIIERLTPSQLDAVLTHELCHVRRRDNLTAATHMIVESVFWFHPLVWWIGVKLVEERERACDEDVLRLGSEPQVYAEGILTVCKFYVESPLTCVAGITSPSLRRRVELIMRNHAGAPLNAWRKLFLAMAGAMTLAAPLITGLINATPSGAESQAESTVSNTPAYEVASIKQNKAAKQNKARPVFTKIDFPPDGFNATAVTLQLLIGLAYEVEDNQILGAPGWVKSEWYDIAAKVDSSVADKLRQLHEDCSVDCRKSQAEQQPMVQALLRDRFKLKLHRETKEIPVYVLIPAKNGSKLKEARSGAPMMSVGPGLIAGQAIPVASLAHMLTQQLGRMVVDKTGLTSKYDLTLKWTPEVLQERESQQGTDNTPATDSSVSIFTAIQEQLGLKLESPKAPVEVLVIDHVEKPSEN